MTGLSGRILAAIIVAALVPTAIVGALAVNNARGDVQTEVVRGHLALVRAVGANLDAAMQDARRALTLAASAWADHPEEADRTLRRVKQHLPLVDNVWILDADMAPVAGDAEDLPMDRARTYGAYMAETCPGQGAQCAGIVVVTQARSRTGELMGFLVARLDLAFVRQALELARLGRNAHLWVVDSLGAVVMVDGQPDTRSPPPGAVRLALGAATEGFLVADDSVAVWRNLASFQTTRGLGWALLLEQPGEDAFALARDTTADTVIVGILCLVGAVLLGAVLAAHLARPLSRLTTHVEAFGAGRTPASPLPLSAPGEIGVLARHVETMQLRIAERERLRSQVARSAQLASVGALAAGVAHEVNNPMTTILGYASLLAEDLGPDDPRKPQLELVVDEARRVQTIVRTLLDHARAEQHAGALVPVDLAAVARRSVRLVEPTARQRRIELILEHPAELPTVPGHPQRLLQVVTNLLQNGLQAMNEGGTLTVAARFESGEVVLSVADTGPGIAPEHLPRLFEPFFTTKGPGVGTGLGLAISHQIVVEHGGRIEVQSEPGVGSTFHVRLRTHEDHGEHSAG